jgi:hypothetical protein
MNELEELKELKKKECVKLDYCHLSGIMKKSARDVIIDIGGFNTRKELAQSATNQRADRARGRHQSR